MVGLPLRTTNRRVRTALAHFPISIFQILLWYFGSSGTCASPVLWASPTGILLPLN
jgi:hypothetical protein